MTSNIVSDSSTIEAMDSLQLNRAVHVHVRLFVRMKNRKSFRFNALVNTFTTGTFEEEARPYKDIPKERGLPYFGTFLKNFKAFRTGTSHTTALDSIKKHGVIWREQQFPGQGFESVLIVDSKDVEKVFRVEGKTPKRINIPGLQDVRSASPGTEGELGVLFS